MYSWIPFFYRQSILARLCTSRFDRVFGIDYFGRDSCAWGRVKIATGSGIIGLPLRLLIWVLLGHRLYICRHLTQMCSHEKQQLHCKIRMKKRTFPHNFHPKERDVESKSWFIVAFVSCSHNIIWLFNIHDACLDITPLFVLPDPLFLICAVGHFPWAQYKSGHGHCECARNKICMICKMRMKYFGWVLFVVPCTHWNSTTSSHSPIMNILQRSQLRPNEEANQWSTCRKDRARSE